MQKPVSGFSVCVKQWRKHLPPHMCVWSVYAQEREERVYTRCLTLDSFCGGRGGAETGAPVAGEGRRVAKQRTQVCAPKPHCVSVHSYTCISGHLERNCFCAQKRWCSTDSCLCLWSCTSSIWLFLIVFNACTVFYYILSQTYLTIPLLIWRQYISFYACCPYVIINSISFHSKDTSFWMINYVISLTVRGY